MSDHLSDMDDQMRADHGLDVQPRPTAENDLPSAHDLAIEYMTERWRPGPIDELEDTSLFFMKRDLTEMFVVLCGGLENAVAEMEKRKEFGLRKYGTHLQPFKGRDSLADARDEIGDAVVYVMTEVFERAHPKLALQTEEDSDE